MSIFQTKTWQTSGSISALNGTLELDCAGSASAVISVSGDFIGVLNVTGSSDVAGVAGVDGGRLLFKSGVGSLGANNVEFSNANGDTEYRIVTGGNSVKVEAIEYTSGTANIKIVATGHPSTIFINGPVHTAEEEAVRNGRAYLASTSNLPVSSGNILHVILENPIDSGVNLFVQKRLFSNDQTTTDTNLTYQAYVNPTATLSQTANTANRKVGGDASLAECTYQVASTGTITMGGTQASGEILPNGQIRERNLEIVIPQGTSIGFTISGSGNNLTNAAVISITFEWYEETIN